MAVLWLATAPLYADSRLQVVLPENGMVVSAGGELIVSVEAAPSAFQSISIVGDGPFALSTAIGTSPDQYQYRQFSCPIPPGFASGRYRFKAAGVTASGSTVYSDTVEVDVERSDRPRILLSEWQTLTLGKQEKAPLVIWGLFEDGSKIDLTRSTRIIYASDRPAVATVSREGGVSATGAGKARIAVQYAARTTVVPVVVKQSPPRYSALAQGSARAAFNNASPVQPRGR
jgi:hypothetical protein